MAFILDWAEWTVFLSTYDLTLPGFVFVGHSPLEVMAVEGIGSSFLWQWQFSSKAVVMGDWGHLRQRPTSQKKIWSLLHFWIDLSKLYNLVCKTLNNIEFR
jgi:hypothetical protein